jgi:tetratricopeptide (TPR) repeat protein
MISKAADPSMTYPRLLLPACLALLAAAPGGAADSLSFRSWRTRAERQEREKDFEAAKSSWSNALSSWRASDGKAGRAKAYCARAALREKAGEAAGARADYSECLELDKKNAKAFHRRGVLLAKNGNRSEAMSDFYRAIALDIRFAAAYHDRARAYEESGETMFAQEDYKRACDLGVMEACPKARSLKTGAKPPKAADAPPAAPPAAPPEDSAPRPRPRPRPLPYAPRFADCRAALELCLEDGGAFGACVARRPRCDDKAVKGCCPDACVKSFGKTAALTSEANAYRQHFSAGAACAAPPPSSDDE